MPTLPLCILLVSCFLLPTVGQAQSTVQTGRYTAAATGPTDAQREPLQAVVSIEFKRDVATIGAAVRTLLADTGYELADVLYWEPELFALHERLLPAVQRTLGPMTVLDALQTLAGPAFRVIVDPIHRLVLLEVDPSVRAEQRALAHGEATH